MAASTWKPNQSHTFGTPSHMPYMAMSMCMEAKSWFLQSHTFGTPSHMPYTAMNTCMEAKPWFLTFYHPRQRTVSSSNCNWPPHSYCMTIHLACVSHICSTQRTWAVLVVMHQLITSMIYVNRWNDWHTTSTSKILKYIASKLMILWCLV